MGPALSSSSNLQQQLVRLQLVGLDLPDPSLLEQVMLGLSSLTQLHCHVSMKSAALQVWTAVNPLLWLLMHDCQSTA